MPSVMGSLHLEKKVGWRSPPKGRGMTSSCGFATASSGIGLTAPESDSVIRRPVCATCIQEKRLSPLWWPKIKPQPRASSFPPWASVSRRLRERLHDHAYLDY